MRYIFLLFLSIINLFAVGPTKVATFDRALWSEPIIDKSSLLKL